MKPLYGYMAGTNLGHWLSQYGPNRETHWDNYVQESDIARIKSWGLDHVRVPVDYLLFESDDNPGVYLENRLAYIDRVLSWCKKHQLNMILDLHHAPGFFFDDGNKNDLFTNPKSRDRYLAIWRFFAERYQAEGDNLIFELLNELVWSDSEPWNRLWQETAKEILRISPQRRIMIGSNYYNSVGELKNLAIAEEDNIIYTFHFYEPFIFTHQKAGWIEKMRDYTKQVVYPFHPKDYEDYFGTLPADYAARTEIGKEYLAYCMQPVFDFAEKYDKTVYCGEYGVIYNAPDESTVRWLSDMADVLLSHGIGRAVWSYRGFSTITSPDNRSFNAAMVEAIARK